MFSQEWRHRKSQTPKRWASRPVVSVRSYGTQTKPTMVDKGAQYEPPEPEPTKTPVVKEKSNADQLNVSFLSDTTISMEDDENDTDYLPDFDMEDLDQR